LINSRSMNDGINCSMMLRALLFRGAFLAVIWWILTGGAVHSWGVGVVIIGLALAFSLRLQPPSMRNFRVARLPRFFLYFLMHSVTGGMQVARMALRPQLDLQPTMMELELRLADEPARILLASVLNLLPGTLSTGLDGNTLHLHVLDRRMPIEREVRHAESWVAWLFGGDRLETMQGNER